MNKTNKSEPTGQQGYNPLNNGDDATPRTDKQQGQQTRKKQVETNKAIVIRLLGTDELELDTKKRKH